jgi:hypothetical protein
MSYDETPREPQPESQHQPTSGASFSRDELLAVGPVERPRRNVAAIVVSLLAVLAVIGGAVGYVGYHKLASSGSQPDQWAPANSIAYLKLDLDPAASEKISALRFEQKFPDAPHVTSADQLKDALLDEVFNDSSGSSKIDYATDVKPWLGDRVALAVYPDASGAAQVVGIVAVKDADAAKTDLPKLVQGQGGPTQAAFALEGDYAIVGQTQTAVSAAVAAAKASNITASSTYSSDIATLKGDRILTGWADLGALVKLAATSAAQDLSRLGGLGALGGLSSLSEGGGFQALTSARDDAPGLQVLTSVASSAPAPSVTSAVSAVSAVKGRFVFGLQLQPGYADFEGRVIGSDVGGYHNGNAMSLLGQLPAGSIAGLSVSGLGDVLTQELATLTKSPLVAAGLQSELDGLGTKLGIALPGDAINLLGNEFAAGLDSVPAGHGTAKFTVITQPTDQAKGLATAQKLASSIDQGTAAPTVRTAGSDVIISNDPQATGSLGDDPAFKAAMSGVPDQVVGAVYVDLAGIWAAEPGTVPSDLTHLTGLGGYEAIDGTDLVFDARLTVG